MLGFSDGFRGMGDIDLAALASHDVDFVLIPELPFRLDGPGGFLGRLRDRVRRRGHAVVVVAEGAGQDLFDYDGAVDASGNARLADIGGLLRQRIIADFATAGEELSLRYVDPGYAIRSVPANGWDAVYCLRLAQAAVHAAMAGRTAMVVGRWHGRFVHIPISVATAGRNQVDPDGDLWMSVLEATGQPVRLLTPGTTPRTPGARPMAPPSYRARALPRRSVQGGEDVGADVFRRPAVDVGRERRHGRVGGLPAGENVGDVAPGEHRAAAVAADPVERLGVADPQEGHRRRREQLPGQRVLDRATAEREHDVGAVKQVRDHLVLKGAEGGLSVVGEDLPDGLARPLFDHLVAVGERNAELRGEQAPHRRLARAHEPDEDDHPLPGPPGDPVVPSWRVSSSIARRART